MTCGVRIVVAHVTSGMAGGPGGGGASREPMCVCVAAWDPGGGEVSNGQLTASVPAVVEGACTVYSWVCYTN